MDCRHVYSDYAIIAENLTFGYNKKTTVLNNFSITIKSGEIFALLGSNGCGKTTFLKILLGSIQPKYGFIRVFGLQPGDKHTNIPGPGAGFMPQELALFPEFSVEENLRYFSKIFHLNSNEFNKRFDYLKKLLNFCERDRRIDELSGGQQRLVSLAVAIIHKPKLIILDEPTVGVDSIITSRIWTYLENMCSERGNTVIITTHYIEEAKRASTVAFMKSGAVLKQSNPRQMMSEFQCKTLEEVYLKLWNNPELSNKKPEKEPCLIVNKTDNGLSFFDQKITLDMKRIMAIVWKFNLRVKKFPIFILCFIFIPFMSILSLNLSTAHLPHDIPVAVHSEDSHDILSNQFIDSINGQILNITRFDSKQSAIDSLFKGRNTFGMFFAKNFTKEFKSRLLDPLYRNSEKESQSMVRLYVDTSQVVLLTFSLQFVAQVFLKFITDVSISLGLNSKAFTLPLTIEEPIYGSNPINGGLEDKYRVNYDNLSPAFLLVALHLSSLLFTAFVMILNRRNSQNMRYFLSGGQPFEFIIAYSLSLMIYITIQIIFLLICGSLIFDIKQKGSYVEVFLLCFIQSVQGMTLGFLFSIPFRDEFHVAEVTMIVLMPIYFMSGIFWPLEGIPSQFKAFTDWTLLSKPIESLRCIMLRGWHFSHPNVMVGYVVSFAYALFIFIISSIMFQIYPEPFI